MSKMKNTRTMLLFLLVTMISLGVSAQNVTVKGTVKDKSRRNRYRSLRSTKRKYRQWYNHRH